MSKVTFLQADIDRIIRAAAKTSSLVEVDLRSLTVTIIPGATTKFKSTPPFRLAPDGKENWDED